MRMTCGTEQFYPFKWFFTCCKPSKAYSTTHNIFQKLMPFLRCYHFHNLQQCKTVGICSIAELGMEQVSASENI